MFPFWLRAFIFALLLFLIINLFVNFPKWEPIEESNATFVLLEVGKVYTCEVERVGGCKVECFLLETATPIKLKPERCKELSDLKRGEILKFRPLNETYHLDGSIPVEVLNVRK